MAGVRWPADPAAFDRRLTEAMALFAVLNLLVAGQPWGVVYGLGTLWTATRFLLHRWGLVGCDKFRP